MSSRSGKSTVQPTCSFCKEAHVGFEYIQGKKVVKCPTLLNTVCPYCREKGHTQKNCVVRQKDEALSMRHDKYKERLKRTEEFEQQQKAKKLTTSNKATSLKSTFSALVDSDSDSDLSTEKAAAPVKAKGKGKKEKEVVQVKSKPTFAELFQQELEAVNEPFNEPWYPNPMFPIEQQIPLPEEVATSTMMVLERAKPKKEATVKKAFVNWADVESDSDED